MKPRGPLMIEHRLIEKMIEVIKIEINEIKSRHTADPVFIDTVVDFIRMYADKTHHGKEEDILFRELKKKKMSPENTRVMNELIEEHVYGRKLVGELVEAKENYQNGDHKSLETIIIKLEAIVNFYPDHIRKEDDLFFPNTEAYFTNEELDNMLEEFWEFDKNMIHTKYKAVYDDVTKQYGI